MRWWFIVYLFLACVLSPLWWFHFSLLFFFIRYGVDLCFNFSRCSWRRILYLGRFISLSLSLVWFICACSLSGCCFITPHCRCLNVDDKRLCVYIEYPPTFASLFFFPSSIFLALIPPLSSSCRMSAGLEIFSLLLQYPWVCLSHPLIHLSVFLKRNCI